jgi:hypothetical protein
MTVAALRPQLRIRVDLGDVIQHDDDGEREIESDHHRHDAPERARRDWDGDMRGEDRQGNDLQSIVVAERLVDQGGQEA